MNKAALVLSALLLACGAPAKKEGLQCLGGTPGDVSVFGSDIGSSEGIAFLNGKLYVAGGQGVREISTDGKATLVASLPASIGMVAWHGALYVAGKTSSAHTSGLCDPENMGVIFKVTTDGQVSTFAEGFVSPNFLAVTPWDTLLVSDDCITNTHVWELTPSGGPASVWSDAVTSANGMVFNASGDSLFVASTFTAPAPVWRLALQADHHVKQTTSVHEYDASSTPDGLAMDQEGSLYVALNADGLIHRITADGTDHEFAEGMITPASMAFGDGTGFDPCSMYTTSLIGTDLYRVVVGKAGQPLLK